MPTSILPPITAPAPAPSDVDSIAARQARTAARVVAREIAARTAQWQSYSQLWLDFWGVLPGKLTDQSARRNEDGLTPAEAWAAAGPDALAYLGAFEAELGTAVAVDATAARNAVTGEDMTTAPAGWTLTPNPADGTVTAAYTAPAPAAS